MFVDMDEVVLSYEIGDLVFDDGFVCMFVGDLCKKLMIVNLLLIIIDVFEWIDIFVNGVC